MGAFTSANIKKQYPGKEDTELYEAALRALPNAGYNIWKTRPLLTLVSGRGICNGKEVYCEILVDMHGTKVSITARAQDLGEEDLREVAVAVGSELDKLVK